MSYPEGMAAANRVLRAAEAWADTEQAPDSLLALHSRVDLRRAVAAYRATADEAQSVIAKETGD